MSDRQLISAHACDRENSGKPDAGNPHVQFDEGGGGQDTGPSATLRLYVAGSQTVITESKFAEQEKAIARARGKIRVARHKG